MSGNPLDGLLIREGAGECEMMTLMMRLMNKILPSCAEVSRLTSVALDESLPLRSRLVLRIHLMLCLWCRRNEAQLRIMRSLARRLAPTQDGAAGLSSDARRRIAEALDQSDQRS